MTMSCLRPPSCGAVWQHIGQVTLQVRYLGLEHVPDPCSPLVTEWCQLPNAARPAPVEDLEILWVLIVAAHLGYPGHRRSALHNVFPGPAVGDQVGGDAGCLVQNGPATRRGLALRLGQ